MAKELPPLRNTFATAREARQEARRALAQEARERDAAQTILNPDEVAGDYDFKRLLYTTLGGQARPLTVQDLKQFSFNSRQLGQKFKGGITAKQVIDLSLQEDRERANKQITIAIPVTNRAGTVQFQTNAGPDSDKKRHQVFVQFMNFDAAVASPKPADKIVGELLRGKIKIECDCGRWRFWYRYIATVGRFNQGRPETGYPKIRNPKLHGVACKHILRVMQVTSSSPTFKGYAIRMIEAARKSVQSKRKDTAVKDMEKFVSELKGESWRQRSVRTTEEKRAARPAPKAKAEAKLKADAAKRSQSKAAKAAKQAGNAARQLQANAKKLLSLGAISQTQYEAMLKVLGEVK